MRKHQLCMTKGGTYPGEGHLGKFVYLFFSLIVERLFSETTSLFSF